LWRRRFDGKRWRGRLGRGSRRRTRERRAPRSERGFGGPRRVDCPRKDERGRSRKTLARIGFQSAFAKDPLHFGRKVLAPEMGPKLLHFRLHLGAARRRATEDPLHLGEHGAFGGAFRGNRPHERDATARGRIAENGLGKEDLSQGEQAGRRASVERSHREGRSLRCVGHGHHQADFDRSRLNHRLSVRFVGRGRIYAGCVIETSEGPGRRKWGVHEIREILKARIGA
jgi:hypothetical protein